MSGEKRSNNRELQSEITTLKQKIEDLKAEIERITKEFLQEKQLIVAGAEQQQQENQKIIATLKQESQSTIDNLEQEFKSHNITTKQLLTAKSENTDLRKQIEDLQNVQKRLENELRSSLMVLEEKNTLEALIVATREQLTYKETQLKDALAKNLVLEKVLDTRKKALTEAAEPDSQNNNDIDVIAEEEYEFVDLENSHENPNNNLSHSSTSQQSLCPGTSEL